MRCTKCQTEDGPVGQSCHRYQEVSTYPSTVSRATRCGATKSVDLLEHDLHVPPADDALLSAEGSIDALVYCIDTKVQSTRSCNCSIFPSSLLRKAGSFSHRSTIVVE